MTKFFIFLLLYVAIIVIAFIVLVLLLSYVLWTNPLEMYDKVITHLIPHGVFIRVCLLGTFITSLLFVGSQDIDRYIK